MLFFSPSRLPKVNEHSRKHVGYEARTAAEIIAKTFFFHPLSGIEFVTKLSSGVPTSVEVSELLYCDVLQNFPRLRQCRHLLPAVQFRIKEPWRGTKKKIAVANAALKTCLFPKLHSISFVFD